MLRAVGGGAIRRREWLRRVVPPLLAANGHQSQQVLFLSFSSARNHDDDDVVDDDIRHGADTTTAAVSQQPSLSHQRVWISSSETIPNNTKPSIIQSSPYTWNERVVDRLKENENNKKEHVVVEDDGNTTSSSDETTSNSSVLNSRDPIQKIQEQEWAGGRMKARQLGVLHEDPVTDMRILTHNYTVGALASALRDREDALQQAAVLAAEGKMEQLQDFLQIFHPKYVLERRGYRAASSSGSSSSSSSSTPPLLDITKSLDDPALERLRRTLMRQPRTVTTAHAKRAAVVLALCTVNNVPCLLMEKRSENLRSHAAEVCLPGGMVCEISDTSIVDTCLREMKEEIGGLQETNVNNVLGVFRCNWGDVHHLVGVAVTPVVCFLGELPERLHPNPDEVSQVFTISLASLLEQDLWVHKDGLAPIFVGGPHPVWGLTGYILDKFAKEILRPNQHTTAKQGKPLET